ncbi:MAG: hypothetical protein F6K09_28570 [Merismopedia sp. SIO2A8]|nr:hypothetical protein [Merismopedia sp. SIO2A8]
MGFHQSQYQRSRQEPPLNQYGKIGFIQCGKLALQLLELGAYHHDLTIRTVIYLMLETRLRADEVNTHHYHVKTLLEKVIPEAQLTRAQSHIKDGQQLFESWNYTLSILAQLNWSIDAPRMPVSEANTSGAKTPEMEHHESSERSAARNWLHPTTNEAPTLFYAHPYPKWLAPDSKMRKPRGWVQTWLDQTLEVGVRQLVTR